MSKPSIEEIKQNLCIFKNAVNKTRLDLDKAFERSINGLGPVSISSSLSESDILYKTKYFIFI